MLKRKVLVCGATGFIGRNLVETLAKQDDLQVYGTYLKREPPPVAGVEFIKANLTNPDEVQSLLKGKDILIQAAANTSGAKQVINNPWIHVTDNAVMNSWLFRAAAENKVKHVIFFSCTVMYHSSTTPLKESDFDANRPLEPKYFGAASTKLYLEKVCQFFSEVSQTKFSVLRHSNIYGPHDKYDLERSHFFGANVTKVMTNESGKIEVWGDGTEKRDLLYVSDLVNCVEKFIERQQEPFSLMNVGYGQTFSVREVIQKIIDRSGKKIEMVFDTSKPSIKTDITLDISKVKKTLDWKPQVSLEEGIDKTLSWYRESF